MNADYRINKQGLIDRLSSWDGFMKREVHLVACGGTAMTLLDVKASTRDIDFLVPVESEYRYLLGVLKQLGYSLVKGGLGWQRPGDFIFDIFIGKLIHTTELLESPLQEGNHYPVKEFEHIRLSVLNYYDIIISKLFRATEIDVRDCLDLLSKKRSDIDMVKLEERFKETASYDVSETSVLRNWRHFLDLARKEGLING